MQASIVSRTGSTLKFTYSRMSSVMTAMEYFLRPRVGGINGLMNFLFILNATRRQFVFLS
ncbi:hypothetical protein MGG_14779 [Pyricularia oryzae 70-15]|uniref:Uncharacterized protein n=1 Tax=Pyricularia oryzae (strain 70-15 / ATCC MYA-4617 / FGSC 8958) TaxID=242507 RepID=G4MZJ6_PYRO7|nr:uncharacterized protein MGG_14779 [Pyricularia oryzae 70-15]EHA54555.1 hypothetical protein MGG_14779 [Pyricularia oryzae 70-15]